MLFLREGKLLPFHKGYGTNDLGVLVRKTYICDSYLLRSAFSFFIV